jgi:hypothetical protein
MLRHTSRTLVVLSALLAALAVLGFAGVLDDAWGVPMLSLAAVSSVAALVLRLMPPRHVPRSKAATVYLAISTTLIVGAFVVWALDLPDMGSKQCAFDIPCDAPYTAIGVFVVPALLFAVLFACLALPDKPAPYP